MLQECGELVSTLDAGVLGRNILMVPKRPSFSENRTATFICLELASTACPYLWLLRFDIHRRDSGWTRQIMGHSLLLLLKHMDQAGPIASGGRQDWSSGTAKPDCSQKREI